MSTEQFDGIPSEPPTEPGIIGWLTRLWRGVRALIRRIEDLERRISALEE